MNDHPAPLPEIPGYSIHDVLGSGGMGTVYAGLDADGRKVAIKVLHAGLAADLDVRTRLRREVATLHRVKGARVAQVLDAELDATQAFIVTELIDGEDLADSVARHGPLDDAELADLATGLAAALTEIHRAGVVHRDLKPGNVMLTDEGPVLIDFGISQVLDDPRLTQTGLVTGTPGYVDPVVLAGADPDELGDWWGWAALLVFAATGRAPFGGGSVPATLQRAQAGMVDVDGVTPVIGDALTRALAPDPRARLAPAQVIAVIDAAASGGPVPQFEPAPPPPSYPPTHPPMPPAPQGPPRTSAMPPTTAMPQSYPPAVSAPPAAGAMPGYPVANYGVDQHGRQDVVSSWPAIPSLSPVAGTTPPPPRTLSTFAIWAALVAVAVRWPGWAIIIFAAGVLLGSTLGSAGTELRKRRTWYGHRRRDVALLLLASPIHLVRGVLRSSFGLVLGLFLGGLAWIGASQANPLLGAPVAIGVLAAVFWWTPPSADAREGTRLILGVGGGAATGVWLVAAAIVIVVMVAVASGEVVWDPLPTPPDIDLFGVS